MFEFMANHIDAPAAGSKGGYREVKFDVKVACKGRAGRAILKLLSDSDRILYDGREVSRCEAARLLDGGARASKAIKAIARIN